MADKLLPRVLGSAAVGCALFYIDSKHHIANDLRYGMRLGPVKLEISRRIKNNDTFADVWYESLSKWRNKECILFEDRTLTFLQVEELSNRVAHWAYSIGLRCGDVVSLFMENCPEYIITWLGLCKIGVAIALINFNLTKKSLTHCIQIANSKILLFGHNLSSSVSEIESDLNTMGVECYSLLHDPYVITEIDSRYECIDNVLMTMPTDAAQEWKLHRSGLKTTDTFGFIYTSGTTGLPKAAVIKHLRMIAFGLGFIRTFLIGQNDRIYCALPLYHSAGGAVGVGMMIQSGASFVIKKKFSVSQFWPDVAKYECTVIQYIGELCRYLLAAPPSPYDKNHKVRIAIGNGLRPDIWANFQDRFSIPEVGEFYGSTEGNAALFNHCTQPSAQGAVGRTGSLLDRVIGFALVKFDVDNEVPIRDENGFCIRCGEGETGELLGLIKENDPIAQFQGYTNQEASQKKIITDVFVKGDKYFRTGDLLQKDHRGYWYFMDRIGDTFRWKGENVSTTEVAEVLSGFAGIKEVNVYGVKVPGASDGRACLAAITWDSTLIPDEDTAKQLPQLLRYAKENLPSYAMPIFIRFLEDMEITGTFKIMKVKLRNEGVDPTLVKDPLFWYNPSSVAYEPFGVEEFQKLTLGRSKL